jgi:hypothetical protein
MLAAGFVAAVASRLHLGGHVNVLVPWTTFASIAIAVLASRVTATPWAGLTYALLLGQLGIWFYNPSPRIPPRVQARRSAAFHALVAELETEGPVLVPSRGHVTTPRHFHIAALADVVRTNGHSPAALVHAIEARRFVAIIDDARPNGETMSRTWAPLLLEDIDDLHDVLLRNYFVAERIDVDMMQTALRAPSYPEWVYRPRERVLTVERSELRDVQLHEMEVAPTRRLQ